MEDYKFSKDYIPALVSIIIPTHNRAGIVCETIDSIFAQSYTKVELIVVDDHSTDNTEVVVKKKQKESKLFDFKYIKSPKKGGCAARNIGLIHCKGEYIQFFDDDDIMLQNHIEEKVAAIGRYDFVTCNFNYFLEDVGNIVGEKCIHNIIHTVESHLLTSSFPAPAFMCRRECVVAIGFWNESIKRLQDISYFHRLFLYGQRGSFLKSKLFSVRVHSQNITSINSVPFLQTMIDVYDMVKKEWGVEKKTDSTFIKTIYYLKFNTFVRAVHYSYWGWAISNVLKYSFSHPLLLFWIIKFVFFKMVHFVKGNNVTVYHFVYGC